MSRDERMLVWCWVTSVGKIMLVMVGDRKKVYTLGGEIS